MQKQGVFLDQSKSWSPLHRDSLENVVARGFPKSVRSCFTTAAAVLGVTLLQFSLAPLKCCKGPWGHQSPRKTHDVRFMITSHGSGKEGQWRAPGLSNPEPSIQKSHRKSTLHSQAAKSLLLLTRLEEGQAGSLAWTLKDQSIHASFPPFPVSGNSWISYCKVNLSLPL